MRKVPMQMETVDASTGQTVKKETVHMGLVPPRSGLCSVCAVDHRPEEPHNAQSMFYLYAFYGAHQRWPTWADAIAHCSPPMQVAWKAELVRRQAWTVPAEGAPIAMAYERQP